MMSALARAFFLSLAVALALDAACAGEGGVSLGGFMCVQPFSPACVDQPATYQKAEKVSACQRELDGYAAATAAYRDCLERQISSAMRQTNDVLDRFHCLSQRDCPPTPKHP
jgi:hypothetical protein